LPGYVLAIEVEARGRALLTFEPAPPCGQAVERLVLSGTGVFVPSGTRGSCYREPEPVLTAGQPTAIRLPNLDSNIDSNLVAGAGSVGVSAGEVSRTGAGFREPAPGYADSVHKPGAGS